MMVYPPKFFSANLPLEKWMGWKLIRLPFGMDGYIFHRQTVKLPGGNILDFF